MSNRNWQQRQAEFMDACGQARHSLWEISSFRDAKDRLEKLQVLHLWTRLVNEECAEELLPHLRAVRYSGLYGDPTGIKAADLAEIYDGIVDTVYVLCGLANAMGIDIERGFEEVHRTNMAKVVDGKVGKREDGKVMKPVGWTPPDLVGMVEKQLADEKMGVGSKG